MWKFQVLLVLHSVQWLLIQDVSLVVALKINGDCGIPENGSCYEKDVHECDCIYDNIYKNCKSYPPKVYSLNVQDKVTFVNSSVYPTITVRWQANEFNNNYGLNDMWGFQIYLVELAVSSEVCKRFDSKLYKKYISNRTGEFNGYFYTFSNNLKLGFEYEVIVQPLPARDKEASTSKRRVTLKDICEFQEHPKYLPDRCCKIAYFTVERLTQDTALIRWSFEERCAYKNMSGFILEAGSDDRWDCFPEPLHLNKYDVERRPNSFHYRMSISKFIEDKMRKLCKVFNITMKCKVTEYEDCRDRSQPVLFDLLEDCQVTKPYLVNDGHLVVWKMNKMQCQVVLKEFEVKTLGVSKEKNCSPLEIKEIVNASKHNMTLNKENFKAGCSYNVHVTCIYQDGKKCKQSNVLLLEVEPDKRPFSLVVGVLGGFLGLILVLFLFVIWKCKGMRGEIRDDNGILIPPTPLTPDILTVGISHDSANCNDCRQAVHGLAVILNSTGYFDCQVDLIIPRGEVTRSVFNQRLIDSSDIIIIIQSHNSSPSFQGDSDCLQLQDFRSQQSYISDYLTRSNDIHKKFIIVYFDKFTDHPPSLPNDRIRSFALPAQLKDLLSYSLGQQVSTDYVDREKLQKLSSIVRHGAFHYKEQYRSCRPAVV